MNGSHPAGMLVVLQHLAVALARHVAAQHRAGHSPPTELLAVAEALRDVITGRQGPSSCACGAADVDSGLMAVPVLLRLPEAAHVLAVSRSTVERLVASGELVSVRVGAGVRVRRDDLEAYIAALPTRVAGRRLPVRANAGGPR